jgi:hypothetical protein
MQNHPCSFRRGGAVVLFVQHPLLKRARGTPDARCARSLVCKIEFWTHELQSPRKHRFIRRSARDGFCGLLRMSPGGRILCYPPLVWTDRVAPRSVKKALRLRAMLWREASRREHATWADARSDVSEANLRPGRIAQRGRQPRRKYPALIRSLNAPPGRTASALRTCALAPCSGLTLPRPPHPAPRIVTIASRPSQWDGMNRNIVQIGILSTYTGQHRHPSRNGFAVILRCEHRRSACSPPASLEG